MEKEIMVYVISFSHTRKNPMKYHHKFQHGKNTYFATFDGGGFVSPNVRITDASGKRNALKVWHLGARDQVDIWSADTTTLSRQAKDAMKKVTYADYQKWAKGEIGKSIVAKNNENKKHQEAAEKFETQYDRFMSRLEGTIERGQYDKARAELENAILAYDNYKHEIKSIKTT